MNYEIRNIPLRDLLHNDKPAYMDEGFGRQPLDQWPVHGFFKLYIQGREDEAASRFTDWYVLQFLRHATVGKARGGMYQGSLYRLIEGLHEEQGKGFCPSRHVVDTALLEQGVRQRVTQRLSFIARIRDEGFDKHYDPDYVDGVRWNDGVIMQGGHHRAASLMVLGYHNMPRMRVFSDKRAYALFRAMGAVKRRLGMAT